MSATPEVDPSAVSAVAAWWDEAAVFALPCAAGEGEGRGAFEGGEPWKVGLGQLRAAEAAFQIDEARRLVTELSAIVPPGPWRRVLRLLELSVVLREADAARLSSLGADLDALLAEIPAAERDTRARTAHLLGVLHLRRNRLDDAERALHLALRDADDVPALRVRILDGLGQVLLGQGAWEESRITLEGVAALRRATGDHLGNAITAGHLAMLELQLGEHVAAIRVVDRVLAESGAQLGAMSRLRLQTFLVQAALESDDATRLPPAIAELRRLLEETGPEPHYLKGYASLALARAATGADEVASWLERARPCFSLPDQVALLRYWHERLLPQSQPEEAWLAEMEALFHQAGSITEAEILTRLHLAERHAGDTEVARRHLELASQSAIRANQRLFIERVDRAWRVADPAGITDQLVRRFSGRTQAELHRTAVEDVTIVFADLVGFTPRSQHLTPEAVMQTCRSFFELAMPLLTEQQVRPLSYLGDGLLAVCQGPSHQARGLRFARSLVERGARVSRVRQALGNRWGLDLRAGVAAGPVVLGVLGNLLKLEFTAIGLTTNLAARLQGQGDVGEVVCEYDTARIAGAGDAAVEELTLKGLTGATRAVRFRCQG